jgi:predicted HTH domain antitoxin
MRAIEIPDEYIELLRGSRLGRRREAEQVKAALSIHLFLEGLVSVGKAAELADMPRVDFEWLLVEMNLPVTLYDMAEDEQDRKGIAKAERRHPS